MLWVFAFSFSQNFHLMLLLIRIFNTFDTPRTKSNGVHILKAMKVSKKLIDFFNTTFSDDFMKTSLFGTVLKKIW